MEIKSYVSEYEESWLRCRVLAFLQTAYFDDVLQAKPTYENPSLELVALEGDMVVGLLDLEMERIPKSICTFSNQKGAMLWNVAVHPDYRKTGVGTTLLNNAIEVLEEMGVSYLEAWTRDDEWVCNWYRRQGFTQGASYLHVFLEAEEIGEEIKSPFKAIQTFAHYTGNDIEQKKQEYSRAHICSRFVKEWT